MLFTKPMPKCGARRVPTSSLWHVCCLLLQGNPVLTLFEAVENAAVRNAKLWSLKDMAKMFASIQHYARLHKKEEMEKLEGG